MIERESERETMAVVLLHRKSWILARKPDHSRDPFPRFIGCVPVTKYTRYYDTADAELREENINHVAFNAFPVSGASRVL